MPRNGSHHLARRPRCGVGPANGAAIKVDIERDEAIAQQFNVQTVPSVIALRRGIVVDRIAGARPTEALMQWLQGLGRGETEATRLESARRSPSSMRCVQPRWRCRRALTWMRWPSRPPAPSGRRQRGKRPATAEPSTDARAAQSTCPLHDFALRPGPESARGGAIASARRTGKEPLMPPSRDWTQPSNDEK
jgi:hypothetical protein